MNPVSRIFVAGHRGLVGCAIIRRLDSCGGSTSEWFLNNPHSVRGMADTTSA